jgi:ribonuclease HI
MASKAPVTFVYTDAGYSQLGEGPIYMACVIKEPGEDLQANKRATPVIPTSSTQAEYYALIWTLDYLIKTGYPNVHIYSDSEVMVSQIKGEYAIKAKNLKDLWAIVVNQASKFEEIHFTHILRKKNLADKYVNILKKEYKKEMGK